MGSGVTGLPPGQLQAGQPHSGHTLLQRGSPTEEAEKGVLLGGGGNRLHQELVGSEVCMGASPGSLGVQPMEEADVWQMPWGGHLVAKGETAPARSKALFPWFLQPSPQLHSAEASCGSKL